MFLDYRNSAFRSHIVANIRFNPAVAAFWRQEFSLRREKEQQERLDAALTRVSTLLTHPHIRHIVGQNKTTVNFAEIMARDHILLVALSAALAHDVKRFIGTILVSELLHAVRNRPADTRGQFCIFVDEFQNFATDDFATLITEARKFGVATTIAHQERFGQLQDNPKILGATSAAANKVFFQLTVKDAQELAPEFAKPPEATETRQETILVPSAHAVEDLWEKGHTDSWLRFFARKYFWITEFVKQKEMILFDPRRIPSAQSMGLDRESYEQFDRNDGTLHWETFTDWAKYSATPEMLAEGISNLNLFYEKAMKQFNRKAPFTRQEISMMVKTIKLLGGVYGFYPVMEAYIPDESKEVIARFLKERDLAFMHRVEDTRHKRRIQDPQYQETAESLAFYIEKHRLVRDWKAVELPTLLSIEDMPDWRGMWLSIGFPQHALDASIQWRAREITLIEEEALTDLVRIIAAMQNDADIMQRFVLFLGANVPKTIADKHGEAVVERAIWQSTELHNFVLHIFPGCAYLVNRYPIKTPSGRYDETLRSEKTQAELITEMAQELANMPRFTAYTKILHQDNGNQTVSKRLINTLPSANVANYMAPQMARMGPMLMAMEDGYCRERAEIEEEIRQRQQPWAGSARPAPPPPSQSKEAPMTSSVAPPPSSFHARGVAETEQRTGATHTTEKPHAQRPPPSSTPRVTPPPQTSALETAPKKVQARTSTGRRLHAVSPGVTDRQSLQCLDLLRMQARRNPHSKKGAP